MIYRPFFSNRLHTFYVPPPLIPTPDAKVWEGCISQIAPPLSTLCVFNKTKTLWARGPPDWFGILAVFALGDRLDPQLPHSDLQVALIATCSNMEIFFVLLASWPQACRSYACSWLLQVQARLLQTFAVTFTQIAAPRNQPSDRQTHSMSPQSQCGSVILSVSLTVQTLQAKSIWFSYWLPSIVIS